MQNQKNKRNPRDYRAVVQKRSKRKSDKPSLKVPFVQLVGNKSVIQ